MQIHSLLVHPNRNSLNGSLFDTANDFFKSRGHSVTTCDVFKEQQSILDSANQIYKTSYLSNWVGVSETATPLSEFVVSEIQKIKDADLLYVQTPIWVYSVPGLLKMYVEQVILPGVFMKINIPESTTDFSVDHLTQNKKVLFSFTTGGSKEMVATMAGGEPTNVLLSMKYAFEFVGFEFLDPFTGYKTIGDLTKDKNLYPYMLSKFLESKFAN